MSVFIQFQSLKGCQKPSKEYIAKLNMVLVFLLVCAKLSRYKRDYIMHVSVLYMYTHI